MQSMRSRPQKLLRKLQRQLPSPQRCLPNGSHRTLGEAPEPMPGCTRCRVTLVSAAPRLPGTCLPGQLACLSAPAHFASICYPAVDPSAWALSS